MDAHEKVAIEIGKIIGEPFEISLNFWRDMRNEVDYSPYPVLDSSLKELALQAISAATSCLSEIANYLAKRGIQI